MTRIKQTKTSEHDEQVAVFQFCQFMSMSGKCPALGLLFAIPNGAKMMYRRNKSGQRYSPEAVKLKAEGLQPGVPDLCLPVARNGYHGLFIEMKVGYNKPTAEQEKWHALLREQGYAVGVPYSAEQAIGMLCDYMGLEGVTYHEDWRDT